MEECSGSLINGQYIVEMKIYENGSTDLRIATGVVEEAGLMVTQYCYCQEKWRLV